MIYSSGVAMPETTTLYLPAASLLRSISYIASPTTFSVRVAVAAPSANLSGSRSAQSGQDVIDDLNTRVDMIIDAGQCQVGISSTIIDLSGDKPKILRQGTISMKEIEKVI
jgi:L-threonylcarbamoyladenylate synthase